MIVIVNDNTICDNTNLNDPINKKGLVMPSLFKVRNQLYNKPKVLNDEPMCSGENCMNDTLFAFFLDNSENINDKPKPKIPIIKTKKKEKIKKKQNASSNKKPNKTKKNKKKSTKK